jgi:hypothetical protein
MKPITIGLVPALALVLALIGVLVAAAPRPAQAEDARKVETQKIVEPTAGGIEVHRGVEGLPAKVAATRQKLLDAAYSGDLMQLRKVMQQNELPPSVSVNDVGDAIEFLKSQSGDGEGLEMLAILSDLLESGWTRVNAGKPTEMYVWPYFAEKPVEELTAAEKVELFKIITSGDFEEMKAEDRYKFFTVGIGPDGVWHYFRLND